MYTESRFCPCYYTLLCNIHVTYTLPYIELIQHLNRAFFLFISESLYSVYAFLPNFYVCESFIGSEKHGGKTQNVQNVSLVAAG